MGPGECRSPQRAAEAPDKAGYTQLHAVLNGPKALKVSPLDRKLLIAAASAIGPIANLPKEHSGALAEKLIDKMANARIEVMDEEGKPLSRYGDDGEVKGASILFLVQAMLEHPEDIEIRLR